MSNMISIRPSRELRNNYAQISKLAKENPVAITVNGKEDTVVLCHSDFLKYERTISELESKLKVYEHLAQAADDVKLGRTYELDAVFDTILDEMD